MKSNKIAVYILEIVLLIYTILFQAIIIRYFRLSSELISYHFWVLTAAFMFLRFHYPKDDSYFKNASLRVVAIALLTLLITVYLLGLFLGYSRSIFSHTPIAIFKNIWHVLLILLPQEYIRHIVCKNTDKDKAPIVVLTLIYIVFNILNVYNYTQIQNNEDVFKFVSGIVLSMIAQQSLYSYITYKISVRTTLLLRISLDIYPYLFPFYPSLGDYITSVIDIGFSFLIFHTLNKMVTYHDKVNMYYRRVILNVILIPVLSVLILIVVLVSGLLKYKMIAIGSNSMVPVYYRGDAVIYEQLKENISDNVEVGDILVFDRNGIIMTHRVNKIIYANNGNYIYITKGDANENVDSFETEENKVLGIVKYRVKYIGYPTIGTDLY